MSFYSELMQLLSMIKMGLELGVKFAVSPVFIIFFFSSDAIPITCKILTNILKFTKVFNL